MSPQYFLVSSKYIYQYPTEAQSHPSRIEVLNPLEPVKNFISSLEKVDLAGNTQIAIILDDVYLDYLYISLPYVKSGKVGKVIDYEIEDQRLNSERECVNSIYTINGVEKTRTDVGVYSISKDLVTAFNQACREKHLELRWIAPISNLLDIKIRQNRQPGDEINVFWDLRTRFCWLYVYKSGVLTATTYVAENSEINDDLEERLKQVNQKITTIGLCEPIPLDIILDDECQQRFSVTDESQLVPLGKNAPTETSVVPNFVEEIISPAVIKHPKRINFLKSNHFILQEVKKNLKGFMLAFTLIVFSVSIYLSFVGYSSIQENRRRLELTQILDSAIKQYLPPGTPPNVAVQALKNRVNDIKRQNSEIQKYELRHYPVSSTFSELSELKQQVPSLLFHRFSLNDQAIRFQGTVDSISEFESLREALPELYAKGEYSITYNQKNRGGNAVEFSIAIQPIR